MEYGDIQAFPLCWPNRWPRTKIPQYSRFGGRNGISFGRARDDLLHELYLLGAKNVIISSNIPLRNDGLPRASFRNPDDQGVAVYFMLNGKSQCFPCDKWERIADNLHAINKTVNAIRGIARWGSKDMIDAAFSGFKAIPESINSKTWWSVLGCSEKISLEEAEDRYRFLALRRHPDHGGSDSQMSDLNLAIEQARILL